MICWDILDLQQRKKFRQSSTKAAILAMYPLDGKKLSSRKAKTRRRQITTDLSAFSSAQHVTRKNCQQQAGVVNRTARVPQGGVISTTLFFIYVNDLTSVIPNFVSNTLHADDLTVWSCEEYISTATHRVTGNHQQGKTGLTSGL